MSKVIKFTPITIGVVLMLVILAYLNWPKEVTQSKRKVNATPVIVHTVQETDFAIVVEGLGTAAANESVVITAQETESVKEVHFDDGDLVKQKQLLLSLNDREERARVHELNINLQEAKRQLQRITNLAKERVASQQLLDEQQARVKALKAQLEVANTKLAELEVRAPFSGVLGIRQVSLGALIRPGDVITTLDDLARIKVDFSISESHLPSINNGQRVLATSVAYPGQEFEGAIYSVGSRVNANTRSIQVRAIIDNSDLKLRPGMLLQVNLQKQILRSLVIPEKSLIPNQDKQFVFVIDDGKAIQKEVIIGRRKPGVVQVISGIQAGQQVVTEGTLRLRNGSQVRILENAPAGGL